MTGIEKKRFPSVIVILIWRPASPYHFFFDAERPCSTLGSASDTYALWAQSCLVTFARRLEDKDETGAIAGCPLYYFFCGTERPCSTLDSASDTYALWAQSCLVAFARRLEDNDDIACPLYYFFFGAERPCSTLGSASDTYALWAQSCLVTFARRLEDKDETGTIAGCPLNYLFFGAERPCSTLGSARGTTSSHPVSPRAFATTQPSWRMNSPAAFGVSESIAAI